ARARAQSSAGRTLSRRVAGSPRARIRPCRDRGVSAVLPAAAAKRCGSTCGATLAAAARGGAWPVRAGRSSGCDLGRARLDAGGRAAAGERIQAGGAIRTRLAAGLGSLALLAGVAAYSALAGDRLVQVVAGLGAAGCALVALALALRQAFLLAWGIAGVGAGYAVFLSLRSGTVDSRAPFVAAA